MGQGGRQDRLHRLDRQALGQAFEIIELMT